MQICEYKPIYRVLIVIQGINDVDTPSIAKNLGAVKRVSAKNTVHRLSDSDAATIILLFFRNVNRTDDISVAIVDIEKLRTTNEVRRNNILELPT